MIDLSINDKKNYPFTLTTDAGQVVLNREEVWKLHFLCWAILHSTDITNEVNHEIQHQQQEV